MNTWIEIVLKTFFIPDNDSEAQQTHVVFAVHFYFSRYWHNYVISGYEAIDL